jgi:hypothetical protein
MSKVFFCYQGGRTPTNLSKCVREDLGLPQVIGWEGHTGRVLCVSDVTVRQWCLM